MNEIRLYSEGEKVIVRPRLIDEHNRPYVATVVRYTPKRVTVRRVETDEAESYLYRMRAEGAVPTDSLQSVETSQLISFSLAVWAYLRELGQALHATSTMRYNLEAAIVRIFAEEAQKAALRETSAAVDARDRSA